MGKDVSMAEKIKLFNAFAGAAYVGPDATDRIAPML